MKQKSTLTLDKEFVLYCEINNIDDINKLANETFSRGFSLLKYGETPFGELSEPKEIIKEVQVEVIKEIEKIVYIDKIVEVPVIKEVIKEVKVEVPVQVKGKTKVVTKEITKEVPIEVVKEVINTIEIDRLTIENEKLKKELETITNSLNKFNKGRFMKNSDMSSLYDE
jgi:hypothetical protein